MLSFGYACNCAATAYVENSVCCNNVDSMLLFVNNIFDLVLITLRLFFFPCLQSVGAVLWFVPLSGQTFASGT